MLCFPNTSSKEKCSNWSHVENSLTVCTTLAKACNFKWSVQQLDNSFCCFSVNKKSVYIGKP